MTMPDYDARLQRLEAENLRLRRAVEELSILNDVALAISSTLSLDEIVNLIVQKCVKHLKVEQGAVLLFDKDDETAALRTMVRKVHSEAEANPFRISDQLIGWALRKQEPLVVNDFANDGRFVAPPGEHQNIRSLMCVPLRMHGRPIGIINVFNKIGNEGFSVEDQRLLTIIAAQSAQTIENARLHEEEQAYERMQQELRLARDIQIMLLPKAPPQIKGYDIAGRTEAARRVGGDYFDFIPAEEGRLAVCLADVSGKGMPASLLMANVQATVRGQVLTKDSASMCLARANALLYDSTDSDKFVTGFLALLDPEGKRFCYSNAGHTPPLWLSEGREPRYLSTGGPVLGVLPKFEFPEETITLSPGDLVLIYSDGFSEAANRRFEEFGDERVQSLAHEHRHLPAAEIIDRIYLAVSEFCGDAPQTDDMTMIVIKVTGP